MCQNSIVLSNFENPLNRWCFSTEYLLIIVDHTLIDHFTLSEAFCHFGLLFSIKPMENYMTICNADCRSDWSSQIFWKSQKKIAQSRIHLWILKKLFYWSKVALLLSFYKRVFDIGKEPNNCIKRQKWNHRHPDKWIPI